MTNLLLFYCDRMQGFFGLGAHINELITYFKDQRDINITVILTETDKYSECTFVHEGRMNVLYIPSPENGLFVSSEDNMIAHVLTTRILQVAYPYLKNLANIVCWFNSIAELNLARQIKNIIPCKILYVHHGWAWKDRIKVEDNIFAMEWRKGNTAFCPSAFEGTNSQLEMVNISDITITVTSQANEYFRSAFDIQDDKLRTIYNGISPPECRKFDNQTLRRELGIMNGERIILYSGRLTSSKGVYFLIDAFKSLLSKLPDCRLVLTGTGALGDILKAAAPTWGKITLTDFVSREWMQKWYSVADVGILPSLMEQCSYAAIEMMFWKVPLIVSAVDGLEEIFEHGSDCLKIPVHHDKNGERILMPLEIEQLLFELLENKQLCEFLTENAYKKALNHFTLCKMGTGYLELVRTMGESTPK